MNKNVRSTCLSALGALACAVMLSISAHADDQAVSEEGQFYLSPGALIYQGPDEDVFGYEDHEVGPGLILGYNFSERWSLELLVGQVENDFQNPAGTGEDDIDLRWLNAMYKFDTNDNWQPFVLFGAGRSEYSFEGVRPDEDDNQFNAGVGVFRALNDHFAIRADLRGVTSGEEGGLVPMAFIGLTGFIGERTPPPPPPDSDGDGVPNDLDKCPTTPAGRVVDADGCELDGDGDGVVDAEDRCPETPAAAIGQVNERGCALDSDGDGVPDYLDQCPDSAAGARVDEKGCYIELEEEVTIDMNIEFDVNSAEIKPEHSSELNRTVQFLIEYPTANAVIEGHTDSDGSAAYNQGLSERRAEAVYNYMIQNAGISADRLSWAGFGEGRPIAPNDTRENKQKNRRVSAVVKGTHTVRQ